MRTLDVVRHRYRRGKLHPRRQNSSVEADAEQFSTPFYDRLFDLSPATRKPFPDDPAEQRCELVEDVVVLPGAAGDLPPFLDRARDLGTRHQTYGVRPDYDCAIGSDWSAEIERARYELYRLIAQTTLEGAAGSLFTARQ